MILLTGASGFLGSYLLFSLYKEGYKVKVVKRSNSKTEQIKIAFDEMNQDQNLDFETYYNSFEWVNADITDFSSMQDVLENVDEILHAAALVSFRKEDKNKILKVNIKGTALLVNLALEKGIEKFHYVSSIASLDRNADNYSNESIFPFEKNFKSTYSYSKYQSEMEVWRGYHEGLKGVIVNPGVILGKASESQEVNKIFRLIQKGFKYYTEGVNGYVDVKDVADFTVELMKHPENYLERYLLVSENISYFELFKMISKGFSISEPSIKASKNLQKFVYSADTIRSVLSGKPKIITRELIALVNSIYTYDNSKVIKASGKKFIPVSETVNEVCSYLLGA